MADTKKSIERLRTHADYLDRQGRQSLAADLRMVIAIANAVLDDNGLTLTVGEYLLTPQAARGGTDA